MFQTKEMEAANPAEQKPLRNGEFDEKFVHIDSAKYSPPPQAHWLLRRIFILTWIKSYNREKAVADLIAGITLGMTIIPQSIAYAALAGLSSEYGLYSAFIGSVIYVFFGTIPQVSIGPTSLMSLLTLQYCADKPIEIIIMLAFLTGMVQMLMGIFQLGFIVSFIPTPVVKAFTTGTAIIVALVQVRNLLGIKVKQLNSIGDFFRNIKVTDATLGITCLVALLAFRQLSYVNFKKDTPTTRHIKKILWYISISRNALVVFFSGLFAFLWIQKRSFDNIPFALSAKVDSAHLSVNMPPFVFDYNNQTYVFTDIVRELGSGIIVVPIVAILANVAIAKAFVKDGNLDASQEMLTLGLCNLAGSFFSAMPTCGAFTRSAVSNASGVRTPMAGIYTGILVFSALSILTPYFQYIPKSSLSAVLIAAVIFMVDLTPIRDLWKTSKKDFFSWVGCLIVCLWEDVQMGLLFGIVVNMLFILMRLGNPKIQVNLKEINGEGYIYIRPLSDVYYTGVDALRTEIKAACDLYKYEFSVVLECDRFMQFDATFLDMFNSIAKELKEREINLIFLHLQDKLHLMAPSPNIVYTNDLQFVEAKDLLSKQ